MSKATVERVRAAYGAIQSIDPSSETYARLISFLDKQTPEALKELAAAKIKFVSRLAFNRVSALTKEER